MDTLMATNASKALVIILLVALATIAGAWGFEVIGGFKPCPLCLTQRWSYYIALPLAIFLVLLVTGRSISDGTLGWGVLLLGTVMLVGGTLGAYHAGIEWGFWPGPTSCTGGGVGGASGGLPDFSKKVVQCDEVQIRIFGLSFAGWNAVISGFCFLVGLWGFAGRSKRST